MRQRRWLELLKDYDTNIQYHLGKANVVADALSRKSGMIAGIKVEEEIIRDLERLGIELCVRGQHGYWASLRIEPDLISQIKEAQKEDNEIWTIIENLEKQVEFHIDEDNVLWQGTRLVVPNDATLREALLTEAHSSPFSVHPDSTKMYHDLKQYFWWSGMKGDVATFVARCLICWQRFFSKKLYDYTVPPQRFYQIETHVSHLVFRKVYRRLGEPGLSSVLLFIPRQMVRDQVEERVIEGPKMIEVMRQRRWLELLKDYDTNIQYHPGKANVVADALSKKSGMIAGIKVEEEIIRDLERLDIELYVRGQHGYWASLRIEPDLISRIKEAQKEDNEICTIIENLDKQVEFHLDDDHVLWQDTRLVVPNNASLREALLTETHSSPFSFHPGSTKMYHDLKQHFWWSGMKCDIAMYVSKCLICQQVKIEHQRASGLLQQLDIPVWKWDEISMDFVTGLPRTQRRHDAIWVVVDRLTKSAHFLPIPRITPSVGPEMIEVTNAKVAVAKEKLKETRTRH
nr:retrotransposon protein, putative, Ty3-gypsy subclass [Tanacetum cinerariifolium]